MVNRSGIGHALKTCGAREGMWFETDRHPPIRKPKWSGGHRSLESCRLAQASGSRDLRLPPVMESQSARAPAPPRRRMGPKGLRFEFSALRQFLACLICHALIVPILGFAPARMYCGAAGELKSPAQICDCAAGRPLGLDGQFYCWPDPSSPRLRSPGVVAGESR